MGATLFNWSGVLFLLRWLHMFAGIVWIGHLYYFNFVQGAFFAETDATTKGNAIQKLVPRALWWFRWGAFWTAAIGILILAIKGHTEGMETFSTSWGINILTGGAMGLIMALNVWFVIWPAQKVVIQSALNVGSGKPAIPEAAARGARAGVASRTNTLLSIPMLFFMGAASHFNYSIKEDSKVSLYALLVTVILLIIEGNALKGKTGPMTTVKGVITWGFVLTLVFYALIAVLI
jgi:uncharacterized membrane protein